jgi:hypothetical protein
MTMDLKIDKTIELDAEGLPVCKPGQIEASTTATVKRACGDAIVGTGEGEVEVAFPEQKPFSATGPIVVFNGGVKGAVTTVLLHAYVNVPAPTAIVTAAKITKINEGRFGMRIQVRVPKIAGGAGSVTEFDLMVGRRYTYKGKKKSFLMAGCPTGIRRPRARPRSKTEPGSPSPTPSPAPQRTESRPLGRHQLRRPAQHAGHRGKVPAAPHLGVTAESQGGRWRATTMRGSRSQVCCDACVGAGAPLSAQF